VSLILIPVTIALFLFGQREAATFLAIISISVSIIDAANVLRRVIMHSVIADILKKKE